MGNSAEEALFEAGGELGELMRAHDWARSPLGPPRSWPQSLKTAVRIMLTSRQPIWIGWGEDLIYLYNDPYKSIIGGKHPWALGRPTKVVWREIWQDIGPMLATAMSGREGTYVESQLLVMERHGYSEETYYTFSYSPIPNDDGSAGGIICANTDDTQRVIGARQLSSLRELATHMADARSVDEVCERAARAMETNGRDLPFAMIYLAQPQKNRAFLAAASGIREGEAAAPATLDLGDGAVWPVGEVIRTRAARTVPEIPTSLGPLPAGAWDRPPAQAIVVPILPQGEAGVSGAFVVGLNPYRLLDEDYRGFLGLAAGQIAARLATAESYQAERRRAEGLAEIDRAKTLFFSNVSHEFRTPLTLMLGPLEDLLAAPAGTMLPANRAAAELAHRNGVRLLKLVNSLLDFSRIEAGRMQATFAPADLPALTAEIASSFRSAFEKAGVALTISAPRLPSRVHLDPELWEKIVLNLLSNAFKFTFAGEVGVEVGLAPDGTEAQVVIRDTGTGIPAADLPRIFERFHRVAGARGRTIEGSGIGLALVQELVKLHGGRIAVESEPDRGTTFTISLPFGSAHLPADRVRSGGTVVRASERAQGYVEEALRWVSDQSPDAAAATPPEPLPLDDGSSRRASGRVLLADDNSDMREYVLRLLVQRGYEVEAVPDGRSAIEAARRRKPDLVLSDVMMPEIDGFGVLRAIRDDPDLQDVPVVLLSARAGEEASVEGLQAGADDYLTKPFSARELLARVGANVQLARLRREATEALRSRTRDLEAVLEAVPAAVWFTRDPDARSMVGNRQAAALLRLPEDANPSLSAPAAERPRYRVFRQGREVAPEDLPIQRAARGEPVHGDELEVRFPDGAVSIALFHALPLRYSADGVAGAVCTGIDITALKQAETELRHVNATLEERVAREIEQRRSAEQAFHQAQKMDAIGKLTGGIAHDFNNLLTAICGSLDLIEGAAGDNPRISRLARTALRAAERGAQLTQSLLAVSRRQSVNPENLRVEAAVEEFGGMVRRAVGESVLVSLDPGDAALTVRADAAQLQSALLNLAINARDAMPDGGTLGISTRAAALSAADLTGNPEAAPGRFVEIAVRDTGDGMAPEVAARAFDPFFTTKDVGKGSGLGLSQVFGFVRQAGGHVTIESARGRGTTVRLFLPSVEAAPAPAAKARRPEGAPASPTDALAAED